MSSRFIIIPDGLVTATDLETVLLTPDEMPSSLYLDFDADILAKLTKDGSDNVSAWVNALGGDSLVQATGNNQPLWEAAQANGKAALKFRNTPAHNYIGMGSGLHDLATGYAWFAVFKIPATDARILFCTSNSVSSNTSLILNGTVNAASRHNSEFLLNIPTNLGVWQLLMGRYDGTTIYGSLNDGAEVSSAIGAPSAARGFYLGYNGVLTGPGNMQIARCGWFNTDLDSTERATVKRILNDSYELW